MGLFTKREKVSFERDEEGRVIQTTRNGVPEGETRYERVGGQGESVKVYVDPEYRKAKTGEQLEKEYYKKYPEKHHPTMKKIGKGISKLDKKIVEYNRRSNIMNPSRIRRTVHPMIGFGFNPPSSRNVNSFGTLFDTGIPKPREKKKSSTKYAIVGGKAYQIAGSGKKKSKKKKRHTKPEFYDPFKSWRW